MPWSDHRYAVRRLDAYVDDELDHAAVDRVTGHLLVCDRCAGHVRFLLEIRASLWRFRGVVHT